MATSWPKKRRVIGTKVQRLDGPAKATGKARYSFDINRKDLLHAAILRCPHAHARIKSLDLNAARRMPGVKAIYVIGVAFEGTVVSADADKKQITVKQRKGGKDVERTIELGTGVNVHYQGNAPKLGDLKANDKIWIEMEQDAVGRELFYAGDEILAIAADTEEHVADALRTVKIDYNELPFLVKEEDALKDDKKSVPPIGGNSNNVRPSGEGTTKGFDKGVLDADATVEGTYGVSTICHQCLESHGLVAEWNKEGGLTVWASTQAVEGTAKGLAGYFRLQKINLPDTKVKCITHYMGGGFGSKFGADIQGNVAAELARKADAPVKLLLNRAEEITVGGLRPSAHARVKISGKKDGSLTAFEIDSWGSSGLGQGATVFFNGLPYVYPIEAKRKHVVLRLNTQNARAMRAPGHPQSCFLTEGAIDDLAAKLGLDPIQVRLKNLPANLPVKKGAEQSYNALRGTIYQEEIAIAAKLADWKNKWHAPGKGKGSGPIKHGIGMALHTWGGQASPQKNECTVTISRNGDVAAFTSTQDLGTAQRTVTAIVVAEILGRKPEQIHVDLGESPLGASSGSGGSTTCPSQAPATLRAALAARDDLFAKIAPKLGAKVEDLSIADGKVVDKASGKATEWAKACGMLGMDTAKGQGSWTFAESNQEQNVGVSNSGVGGVQIAEVLVDTETGVVRCTKVVAVQDCGLIINLQGCLSQVAGGVIMSVNYALFEERIMDRVTGRMVNPNMEFYKLGGIKDMPEIVVHMHDMPERGVIGIGEPPTISTHAAISNAIFNALGVRVGQTPFTPDRVLAALAAKEGK